MRGCPYDKPPLNQSLRTPPQFSNVPQYCKGCVIDHLSKDFPYKPVATTTPGGKIGLNLVEIIPSPTSSEIEPQLGNVPVRVITRN